MSYRHHVAGSKRGTPQASVSIDLALKAKYRNQRTSLNQRGLQIMSVAKPSVTLPGWWFDLDREEQAKMQSRIDLLKAKLIEFGFLEEELYADAAAGRLYLGGTRYTFWTAGGDWYVTKFDRTVLELSSYVAPLTNVAGLSARQIRVCMKHADSLKLSDPPLSLEEKIRALIREELEGYE